MVNSSKRILKKHSIIIAVLALIIYLLMLFANYPQAVERYYSEGLFPVVCHILHPVFNLFPFSVGDVLYIAVIIYLIYALVKFVKLLIKKEFMQGLFRITRMIIKVQAALLIFYMFWGMNYFRPSAGKRLNLRDTSYTTESLKAVT